MCVETPFRRVNPIAFTSADSLSSALMQFACLLLRSATVVVRRQRVLAAIKAQCAPPRFALLWGASTRARTSQRTCYGSSMRLRAIPIIRWTAPASRKQEPRSGTETE
eukprot:6488183-Amphidinium_carterae.1